MMQYVRLKEVEKKRGDLHSLIPPLVNERGQEGAAQELGVSQSAISTWLKKQNYIKVTTYVRRGNES